MNSKLLLVLGLLALASAQCTITGFTLAEVPLILDDTKICADLTIIMEFDFAAIGAEVFSLTLEGATDISASMEVVGDVFTVVFESMGDILAALLSFDFVAVVDSFKEAVDNTVGQVTAAVGNVATQPVTNVACGMLSDFFFSCGGFVAQSSDEAIKSQGRTYCTNAMKSSLSSSYKVSELLSDITTTITSVTELIPVVTTLIE